MSGFFTFVYFCIAILISFTLGANWLSGSLLLGSACALFGGSGAKGMWHSTKKLIGLTMGVVVTGIGVYIVQDSGVWLRFGGLTVSADLWVIVGAVIFFLVTTKEDSVETSAPTNTATTQSAHNTTIDNAEQIEAVCYAYLKIWGELGLAHIKVYDESKLPCKKDSLITILKHWLSTNTDPIIKEGWGNAFSDLSSFQPNIGDRSLGISLSGLPKTDDVDAIVNAVLSSQIPTEIQTKVAAERAELGAWYAKNVYAET
jgi:hypothetical protein